MFVLPENPFNVGRWLAVAVSNACYKTTGEGLAARGLLEFVKVEGMIEERSSSSIMPQAAKWHLPHIILN